MICYHIPILHSMALQGIEAIIEKKRLTWSSRHISYQRAKRNTNPNTSLIQIEGVGSTEDARYALLLSEGKQREVLRSRRFYLGKKVAYVYRAQREVRGTKIRVIWGKITRT